MPIRTNRGRAVVYRRLWAWPLRSPRHLGMAVLSVAVLATIVAIVMPDRSGPLSARGSGRPVSIYTSATTGSQGAAAAATTVTTTRTTATPSVTTTPPVSAPAAPEALNVANAWARAWVNHPAGMNSEEWVAQLAPLTTEEFLPQLQTVDPANIPSTTVTGPATSTTATARVVEADVPTDGAVLHLIVIATPAGWRVSAYDRSE